jgi:hypothetical protein
MEQPSPDNAIAHGHETAATNLRPVWWSAAALVALSIGTFILIAGMMRLFATSSTTATTETTLRSERELPAGAPALSVDLALELQRVMAQQRAVLSELDWVDQSAGIARIPIDEAISIVAKNGLPAKFGSPATKKDSSDE